MNKEIKAKWIAALESGKYKKAQARLLTVVGGKATEHCCLGVLACVMFPDEADNVYGYETGFFEHLDLDEILDKAEITHRDEDGVDGGEYYDIVQQNDYATGPDEYPIEWIKENL